MLKVLAIFGVVFTSLFVALVVYVGVEKPFGIELQKIPSALMNTQKDAAETGTEVTDHPLLTASQEATLKSLGVDPSTIPTSMTPELLVCFKEKLGEERVAEIEAGASLAITDYIKARGCIE